MCEFPLAFAPSVWGDSLRSALPLRVANPAELALTGQAAFGLMTERRISRQGRSIGIFKRTLECQILVGRCSVLFGNMPHGADILEYLEGVTMLFLITNLQIGGRRRVVQTSDVEKAKSFAEDLLLEDAGIPKLATTWENWIWVEANGGWHLGTKDGGPELTLYPMEVVNLD